MRQTIRSLQVLCILGAASSLYAEPVVNGNRISWPDDGWYQVQTEDSYLSVCEGGSQCDVPPGSYIVINHSTGARWPGIRVLADTADTEAESDTEAEAAADSADTSASNASTAETTIDTVILDTLTVTGAQISWTHPGWTQVQAADTYATVCEGVTSCMLQPGTYHVIDHGSGRRWDNLEIAAVAFASSPRVDGDTLSWADDGWYQVQHATTYDTICEGGRSCTAEPGVYVVINHSTGTRWSNIVVTAMPAADSVETEPTDNPFRITANTIEFVGDGWFQVQRSDDYTSVCEGVPICNAPAGEYTIINHSTGARYNNVAVANDSDTTPEPDSSSRVAPLFETVAAQTAVAEYDYVWFTLRAYSTTGHPRIEAISIPSDAYFSSDTPGQAQFEWAPGRSQSGSYDLVFVAIDPVEPTLRTELTVPLQVDEASNSPPFLNYADTSDNAFSSPGIELQWDLSAEDVDDDALQFFLEDGPATVSLTDFGNGRASVFWTPGDDDLGRHNIVVGVTDGEDVDTQVIETVIVPACVVDSTGVTVGLACMDPSIGTRLSSSGTALFGQQQMKGIGDFNGDGLADIGISEVLTDYFDYPPFAITRIGYVVYGSTGVLPETVTPLTLDGTNGFSFRLTTDHHEATIRGIGDINGDGHDDVCITLPQASAYVLYGDASAAAEYDLDALQVSSGFRIVAFSSDSGQTPDCDAAGDVNGDGIDDFLLYRHDYDYLTSAPGYVIFGQREPRVGPLEAATLAAESGMTLRLGHTAEMTSGDDIRLIPIGDINDDGFSDLYAGAGYSGNNFLVFGSSDRGQSIELDSQSELHTREPDYLQLILASGDPLNIDDLSGGADFNGDNIDDLALRSSRLDSSAGEQIALLYGSSEIAEDIPVDRLASNQGRLLTLAGRSASTYASDINLHGDTNGDGFADLVISRSPDYSYDPASNAVYIVYGRENSDEIDLNLRNQTSGRYVYGQFPTLTIQGTIDVPGDINGDGYDDVLIQFEDEDPDTGISSAIILGR